MSLMWDSRPQPVRVQKGGGGNSEKLEGEDKNTGNLMILNGFELSLRKTSVFERLRC